jgi:hypothetical protein
MFTIILFYCWYVHNKPVLLLVCSLQTPHRRRRKQTWAPLVYTRRIHVSFLQHIGHKIQKIKWRAVRTKLIRNSAQSHAVTQTWSLIKRHLNHGCKCKLRVFYTLEALRREDLDALCAIIRYKVETDTRVSVCVCIYMYIYTHTCIAAAIIGNN